MLDCPDEGYMKPGLLDQTLFHLRLAAHLTSKPSLRAAWVELLALPRPPRRKDRGSTRGVCGRSLQVDLENEADSSCFPRISGQHAQMACERSRWLDGRTTNGYTKVPMA